MNYNSRSPYKRSNNQKSPQRIAKTHFDREAEFHSNVMRNDQGNLYPQGFDQYHQNPLPPSFENQFIVPQVNVHLNQFQNPKNYQTSINQIYNPSLNITSLNQFNNCNSQINPYSHLQFYPQFNNVQSTNNGTNLQPTLTQLNHQPQLNFQHEQEQLFSIDMIKLTNIDIKKYLFFI